MLGMTKEDIEREKRIAKARNMRYKRPALSILGYEDMIAELDEIDEECSDVTYMLETDKEGLLDALGGNDDEANEITMALHDIQSRMYLLREQIYEVSQYDDLVGQTFDDAIVGLIGNRYDVVGYDGYQEDYFHLAQYEQDLAVSEAGKRLCRRTKADMLATIGQCMGIALAYIDVRNDYFALKASFDIIRDHNAGILSAVKELEALYDKIITHKADEKDRWRFQDLCAILPDRVWVE